MASKSVSVIYVIDYKRFPRDLPLYAPVARSSLNRRTFQTSRTHGYVIVTGSRFLMVRSTLDPDSGLVQKDCHVEKFVKLYVIGTKGRRMSRLVEQNRLADMIVPQMSLNAKNA